MYGYECPECGATLDPGEKCDCGLGLPEKEPEANFLGRGASIDKSDCLRQKQTEQKNVLGREEACEAATKQTSSANAQLKIHFNYTTLQGGVSSRSVKKIIQ